MQIVINIPEEEYQNYLKIRPAYPESMFCYIKAIQNGTPLPKGHGDLVDYEELKNNAREYGAYAETTLSHIKPKVIIETDKAESEGKE